MLSIVNRLSPLDTFVNSRASYNIPIISQKKKQSPKSTFPDDVGKLRLALALPPGHVEEVRPLRGDLPPPCAGIWGSGYWGQAARGSEVTASKHGGFDGDMV